MKYLLYILISIPGIIIFLLIAALLLLAVPVTVRIRYADKKFTAYARVLFLRFNLMKLRKSAEKKKAIKEKKEKGKKEKKKTDFKNVLQTAKDMKQPIIRFLKTVLKSITVKFKTLRLVARGEDAGKAGMNAGLIWSSMGVVCNFLDKLIKLDCKKLEVLPDYFATGKLREKIDCKITLSPIIIVYAALRLALNYFKFKGIEKSPKRAKTLNSKNVGGSYV
ncbi:MAG: DUF2953 domain-containing protein [Ruminococcaceae bacterium]|mgnify:CR=1 FL=1|nr:DUF2953 domain-containing protein [Oscillospiraceae bacterium]